MYASSEFAARVAAELAGTPFAVTPTPRGFDASWNLADAYWKSFLQASGVRQSITFQVSVNEARRTFRINDVTRSMSWGASALGTPTVSFGFFVNSGGSVGSLTVNGTNADGSPFRFSSGDARRRIKAIGIELGLKPRMSKVLLGSLLVAPIAVAITGIVLGITLGIVPLLSR